MTRVYLHTFGCKANQYDTEVVRQALEDAGATIVGDPGQADAAVVNSCTVTHVGEAKMRGLVRRLARRRPDIRTVVVGCAAAVDDGTLGRLPGVVAVRGGAEPADVCAALDLPHPTAPRPLLRRFARGTRAWLKIQDGCDEHCTFCATVLARGASRSRTVEDVVAEARLLAEHAEEIVLTGVHIGGYGRDLERGSGGRGGGRGRGGVGLGALMERLVVEVPRVRFRLSSVEATELDDALVELMAHHPDRLVPHLHAPLQSGSDLLLRRMGRHWYTASEYRRQVERVAGRLPVFALGADVIVGFPGETGADHAATRLVLAELPFTYVHVFPYSARPDAPARRFGEPVPAAVAQERSAELRALVAAKGKLHATERSGEAADVVLLRRRAGHAEGLTEDYLSVTVSVDTVPAARFAARLEHDAGVLTAHPLAA
ncbi:MAG: MiaB/RimO family radical SAM methylthiotransferase [Gemmatimonadota bacterium]|nr:MiaB/RimO family radical SAM methylthiotransferase [Gemmatimonadota bacterium]